MNHSDKFIQKMDRFLDPCKEIKFSDWTIQEILNTDDYWMYQGGLLHIVQSNLIRLLEGFNEDDCHYQDFISSVRELKHYKRSEERLGRVFRDTFRQFCVIGTPEDPNEETFEDQYVKTYDSKSFRLITNEERERLEEILKRENESDGDRNHE